MNNSEKTAKILVCLAACNGSQWIQEQINSILSQQEVNVSILVSVSQSDDNTFELLNSKFAVNPSIQIIERKTKSDSAAMSFFFLISSCFLFNFDYLAISDQDYIWLPEKLKKGTDEMMNHNSEFYSSNVTAFWANGRKRKIIKNYDIPIWNHFFESAGPGCTYLLKRQQAIELSSFLREKRDFIHQIELHDWLIFSWARSNGYKWFVDDFSGVLYRQHSNNVFGANVGWMAAKSRWDKLTNGWYRNQVLLLCQLFCEQDFVLVKKLANLNLSDRIYLAFNTKKMRRYWFDQIILALAFLFMKKVEWKKSL